MAAALSRRPQCRGEWSFVLRIELRPARMLRSMLACSSILLMSVAAQVEPAQAGLLDFLFGGGQTREAAPAPSQSSGWVDPFTGQPNPVPPAPVAQAPGANRSASAHCVRLCDGKYFPILARGGATPAQICQSFCPASETRVYYGGTIDNALALDGGRYSELPNAFGYRKKLNADCTCNGRDPSGLAPMDITLDTTLRPGDIVATSTGLVAYSGSRVGNNQTAEFTPVANYPGLTADLRAKLGEMKVAPVTADVAPVERLQPSPDVRAANARALKIN